MRVYNFIKGAVLWSGTVLLIVLVVTGSIALVSSGGYYFYNASVEILRWLAGFSLAVMIVSAAIGLLIEFGMSIEKRRHQ